MTANDFGLSREDLEREAARFGVADDQVHRDHAISHILSSIAKRHRDEIVFFGGTALSRTHLVHARLSEDIDLLALGDRREIANRLITTVDTALLRTHGRPSWSPVFSARDVEPAVIETPSDVSIRLQLLDGRNYQPWPTERRDIEQRYRDAPPAALVVPTIAAFAGWKTAAWSERKAPRDLYDLWALAEAGAVTEDAADLFARYGPTGRRPRAHMFAKAPSEDEWSAALSAQTRLHITAAEALVAVRISWSRAVGEMWD